MSRAGSGALLNPGLYTPETRKHATASARTSRTRLALGAAWRLLEHRPPDWPVPKTAAETIATVQRMMVTPRKFGVVLTKPERRALEWAHALHDEVAEKAKAAAGEVKELLGEVSQAGGGPAD